MYIADDEVRKVFDGWQARVAAKGEFGNACRSETYGMYMNRMLTRTIARSTLLQLQVLVSSGFSFFCFGALSSR